MLKINKVKSKNTNKFEKLSAKKYDKSQHEDKKLSACFLRC